MPKSMRVMGTIEPEKVWTYLKRVKQTTNESIGAFGINFENSGSWSGVEAVPCSSGWCAKVVEGKGTFKGEDKMCFLFRFLRR
jgi:hypothetical protein